MKLPRSLLILPLIPCAVVWAGCAAVAVGAAAGGVGVTVYAVTQNGVEGNVDYTVPQIYEAAQEVAKSRGEITELHPGTHKVRARIDGANVIVTPTRLTDRASRIKVDASKGFIPKKKLAGDIYKAVVAELEQR